MNDVYKKYGFQDKVTGPIRHKKAAEKIDIPDTYRDLVDRLKITRHKMDPRIIEPGKIKDLFRKDY